MNKLLGLLSLCRKAGKLRIGFEPVKEAAGMGEARLVLYAADFSPRSRERMERALEGNQRRTKPALPPEQADIGFSMEDLAQVCGKLAGVVAVVDDGFAAGMKKLMCSDEGGAE